MPPFPTHLLASPNLALMTSSATPADPNERSQLEKYLTDYSHQPLKMPVGWSGEGK